MPAPENSDVPLPAVPALPPLLQLVNQLEQAWQSVSATQPAPDLATFLPPPGDFLRLAALQELVRLDLSIRWRRGIPALLETYVRQFPELGDAASLAAELIYTEYHARWQHGDHPLLADYQNRFPAQYSRLLRIVQRESGQPEASTDEPPPATLSLPEPADAEDSLVWESQTSPPEATPTPTPTPVPSGQPGHILPAPAPSAPPAGDSKNMVPLAGGYRLLKRLGSGALGEVWKAEAPGGVEVAVKRLSRTLEAHEAQCELRSLEHVKRLRHNHLMPIHAFWVHKSRLYVAMELADSSLYDRAKHYQKQGLPGIPQDELLRYLRESAEALDYLHSEGIHHRDIKPANILLLKGHVKVADFGLARPLGNMDSVVNATFCGTPTYMPPEVWENKISVHSDQWSLAISYLELRLNRRVFKGRSMPSLMLEIREAKLDLSPLGAAEQRVLRKALNPDPRQRYASCTAFAQALDAVFHPAAPPPRRGLSLLVVLCACLAAGGLLASLYYFWPRQAKIVSTENTIVPVYTGRTEEFKIPIRREHYGGPVEFVPDEELSKVHIRAEAAEGADLVTVWVEVEEGAKPGTQRVRLQTDNDKLDVRIEFELNVVFLPRDFEQLDAAIKDENGGNYPKRIRGPLNKKTAVEFVLIPRLKNDWQANAGVPDPPTFYISRFKISREQFRCFAAQNPKKLKDARWKDFEGDDGRMPMRGVAVADAHAFAAWLGGLLPSRNQWDKAAGGYHPLGGKGPYKKGQWDGKAPLRIAVGELAKPLPLGSAATEDDESIYLCRDMGGNGSEWTRDMPNSEVQRASDIEKVTEVVHLRGWSFTYSKPLTFKQHDDDDLNKQFGMEMYRDTARDLGFRIVLEPNHP